MMRHSALVFSLLLLASHTMLADDAKHALQVVRLKPGESKLIEIALPSDEFRPAGRSGRSDFDVQAFPEKYGGEFTAIKRGEPIGKEFFKAAPYPIAEGVTLHWSEDKPAIVFEVDKAVKAAKKDVLILYTNFGGKNHTAGFRVIVEE